MTTKEKSHRVTFVELSALLALLALVVFCLPTPPSMAQQDNRQLKREQTQRNGASGRRVALVIGNGAYTKSKALPNPANDAADMTTVLKNVGFEVLSGTDLNRRQMMNLIRDFGAKQAPGGVSLFYYAGHGIQVGGENCLIPVDAEIPQEDEVAYAAVPLGLVLTKMTTAKNDLSIVILDACRNNPFARSWTGYRDVAISDAWRGSRRPAEHSSFTPPSPAKSRWIVAVATVCSRAPCLNRSRGRTLNMIKWCALYR